MKLNEFEYPIIIPMIISLISIIGIFIAKQFINKIFICFIALIFIIISAINLEKIYSH